MRSYFPDVNVWIALTYSAHVRHAQARLWFERINSEPVFFCRFTQLGFLRLLTNAHVMGSQVRSQKEAWRIYDRWFTDSRVSFFPEPSGLDAIFRGLTESPQPATKVWPDAYLAAVARKAGLTLVTLDRAFTNFEGLVPVVL